LTTATLWQFSGCVTCYFLGALLFTNRIVLNYLLIGVLAAFAFCLVRAVDQKLFEFPLNHQMLVEGERSGWTNFPPEAIVEMKHDGVIISTNGTDMASPVILDKFKKGRVAGTLVYPNALAGLILLLSPVSLVLAFSATRNFKPLIRYATVTLAVFLCAAAFFWTGSKLGWLISIGITGTFLLRLNWSKKIKIAAVLLVLVSGLGIFGVRFHHYFSNGATSASARLDYWHAAVQTTLADPFFGSGPGTFQRPYARLKSPESEMARLTHNDYLEQFSDSGIIGGLAYLAWIGLTLILMAGRFWRQNDQFYFAVLAGLTAWFVQGFGEFSLYIPALAWIAFTLLGCLIGSEINEFDKKTGSR
jgi:O-antigen ligase